MNATTSLCIALLPTIAYCFLNCYLPGDNISRGIEFEVRNRNIQYFYMHQLDPERFAWFNHSHGRCLQATAAMHHSRFILNIACLAPPFTVVENVSEIEWLVSTYNFVCRLGKGSAMLHEGLELYIGEKKSNKIGLLAINEEPTFTDVRSDDPGRVRYDHDCFCHYRIVLAISYNHTRPKTGKAEQRNDFSYGIVTAVVVLMLFLLACVIGLILYCML